MYEDIFTMNEGPLDINADALAMYADVLTLNVNRSVYVDALIMNADALAMNAGALAMYAGA